jgi:hypothetical protein
MCALSPSWGIDVWAARTSLAVAWLDRPVDFTSRRVRVFQARVGQTTGGGYEMRKETVPHPERAKVSCWKLALRLGICGRCVQDPLSLRSRGDEAYEGPFCHVAFRCDNEEGESFTLETCLAANGTLLRLRVKHCYQIGADACGDGLPARGSAAGPLTFCFEKRPPGTRCVPGKRGHRPCEFGLGTLG